MYTLYTLSQAHDISLLLTSGKVGVLPTDTIYGLHCIESNIDSIKRIYALKKRSSDMPYITLISEINDLQKFGIRVDENIETICKKYWPGPNTLIIEGKSFRIPAYAKLLELLKITGPLLSTSANIHQMPNVKSVGEACRLFGNNVDFYVDEGLLNNPPSSIYKINEHSIEKIR